MEEKNCRKKPCFFRDSLTRYALILAFLILCTAGCLKPISYTGEESREWIMEQVENGTMSQEQADRLLEELYPEQTQPANNGAPNGGTDL